MVVPVSPIMTYTSLTNTLITYCQRQGDTQFLDQLPFIIYTAQCRISWGLEVLGLEKLVTSIWTSLLPTFQKPSNWLRTVNITMQDPENEMSRFDLKKRLRDYVEEYKINSQTTGRPVYFSDNNFDSFIIGPVPKVLEDAPGYPFTLVYHELLQPLSEVVQSNWLTQRVPHLFLYACLADAFVFLGSFEQQSQFQQMYERELNVIKTLDKEGKFDRSGLAGV